MPKIKPQILSRPPLERMMRFHNLIKEDSFPNCTKLAQEFEVTVRTVMRDLDFMRDRLLLPIEFDSQRNGFHYTEPVDQFPQMPFSEAEIFALRRARDGLIGQCATAGEGTRRHVPAKSIARVGKQRHVHREPRVGNRTSDVRAGN